MGAEHFGQPEHPLACAEHCSSVAGFTVVRLCIGFNECHDHCNVCALWTACTRANSLPQLQGGPY